MATLPNSPSMLKGGIVLISPDTSPVQRQATPPGGAGPAPVQCGATIILDRFEVSGYRLMYHHYRQIMQRVPGLRALSSDAQAVLRIDGHTDSSGTEIMNAGLSLNCAMEVQRFFDTLGIAMNKKINALGESHPIAYNATAAGRQINRRVEPRLCLRIPPPITA